MKFEETDIQIRLVNRLKTHYPDLLFTSTLAGVNLPIHTAVRLKRMGYLAGVSDLLIFRARGNYLGLFVELKRIGGKCSDAQRAFQVHALVEGYKAVTCYGFDDAVEAIDQYLKG